MTLLTGMINKLNIKKPREVRGLRAEGEGFEPSIEIDSL